MTTLMTSFSPRFPRPRRGKAIIIAIAAILITASFAPTAFAAAPKQTTFPSPEAGVQALVDAMKARDEKGMLAMLGPEAKPLIDSGDQVADEQSWDRFVASYEAKHELVKRDDGAVVVQTGDDQWPMPVPLVETNGAWRFDTPAGQQEILDRRIGRNELDTIQSCLAFVDAQREYYASNPQGGKLPQYAPRVVSTKGKHDGLYWETKDGEPPSPLGPNFARARAEGYKEMGSGKGLPYHGYYYRILTAQGPDANGGAYDYLVKGAMFGGFALVAYPAEYGASGVMTFLVNHDGVVFEKDLGPKTTSLVKAMKTFNPDKTWTALAPS